MSACVFGHPKITLPLRLFVKESRDSSEPASDSLEEVYREQIMDAMKIESERRIHETHDNTKNLAPQAGGGISLNLMDFKIIQ